MINWDTVLNEIKEQEGDVRTLGVDFYQNKQGQFNHIISLWNKAGYAPDTIEWINYYPEKHFDLSVSEQFADIVGAKHIRSWISCIRPGKNAPWHQDIDDNMDEYEKLGKLERWTCFINKPAHGQTLLIEKDQFYMMPQGTNYLWPNILAWHGASNCGFENHYLYHFLGYANI